MEIEFQRYIKNKYPYLLDKTVLLAVSGGIDSVVLLHLCCQLKMKVVVAHCNFHLREEESNEDQVFVEQLTQRLGVPYYVAHFDTEEYANREKVSIQIAARELRYKWFYELLEEKELSNVLVAHHLDDSMETFLINFSRGTGIEGLLGIPEVSNRIVRPLLPFTREEITNYALNNNIEWREDRTNAQTKYLRNKIRKLILPIFKEINPHLGESFKEMINYLQDSFELSQDAVAIMYQKAVQEVGEGIIIDLEKLKEVNNAKAYLYYWLRPYGFTAWSDIEGLINAQSGKMIYSKEYVLLKDRNHFFIKRNREVLHATEEYYLEEEDVLKFPISISTNKVEGFEISDGKTVIYVDKDQLTFPLKIRKYRTGDIFFPIGMKGSKKVSKFFKDEKFNQFEKESTWLLCSQDKIVWIIGSRMDERFKVKNTTINILKIQLKQ